MADRRAGMDQQRGRLDGDVRDEVRLDAQWEFALDLSLAIAHEHAPGVLALGLRHRAYLDADTRLLARRQVLTVQCRLETAATRLDLDDVNRLRALVDEDEAVAQDDAGAL